ncbi:MAG: hypothetical protein ACI84C_001096 [Flavobacteriales bacterium]|jgi:hypothetical protein
MSSCSKHAEKIADTCAGTLTKNDTIISTIAQVVIEEVAKNRISVNSIAFDTHEVEIDKKEILQVKVTLLC